MIKYKRRALSSVWWYSEHNFNIEVGDLIVCPISGKLYRAEESNSWPKRMRGELYPRLIRPPNLNFKATIINGDIYWVKEDF